jgi:aspartate/methionine/tyrosine aminotransferase
LNWYYQSLKELPYERGCSVSEVELKEENDWHIDVDEIKKNIRPNTKMVVINFPHNPSGQVITQKELEFLIKILRARGIWLFADEVYRLLGNPNEDWVSPAACNYEKAISLGVMSKAFGLAGLRVGWIACKDQAMLQEILDYKHYLSITNSAPSEILSLIAIKNAKAILHRNNQIVSKNLTCLDRFLDKHKSLFSWVRPQGGCVGFIKYHGQESVEEFCKIVLDECGVLIMPAEIFDHHSFHFRIGFGRNNFEASLKIFEEFLACKHRN